jgi:hypothetical protein
MTRIRQAPVDDSGPVKVADADGNVENHLDAKDSIA